MKRFCTWITLVIVLCFASAATQADVFYVGPNGLDGRFRETAKNRDRPWRTIQKAMNEAGPGDQVIVLDGTYWEQVNLTRSGQPGKYIELKSENREGAFLVGSIVGSDVSFIKIEGLELSNRRTDAVQSKGIAFYRSHHLIIRNNRVHDCRGGGISCDQSDWLLIEWNIVHSNAFFDVNQHSGISIYQSQYRGTDSPNRPGVIIRNNTCFANRNLLNNPIFGRPTDGNGIVIDDSKNETNGGNGEIYDRITLVENNLCFLNGGQGVHCYLSNNVHIRNNTCFKNLISFDFGGEISVVASQKVLVWNNLLFAREGRNVALQFEPTGQIWWDYNLLHNGPVFQVNNGPNTIYANPLFTSGTFEPRAGSPAINSGLTSQFVFPLDVNGKARIVEGATDRGASEFDPGR